MSKITSYAALSATQPDDVVPVVDTHDTTMAATGTTKQITVANLLAGAGTVLAQTAVVTAAHSAAASEVVKADVSGGSFPVNLPSGPAAGTLVTVKVVSNAAGNVNACTVTCAGSDVFNKPGGSATHIMTKTDQSVLLEYNVLSGAGVWLIAATDDAAAQTAITRQGTYYLDEYTGTDDQKMTSALAAAVAAGGGTVALSARAHTFANQWTTSYTGTGNMGIRVIGAGAWAQGDLANPPGGITTVVFTYSGSGAGQVDFQHSGYYEIAGIYFRDTVNTVPFIFSTNPQPDIHHCVFTGTGTGATCGKDAIVLGGNGAGGGAGDTAKFNAYGGEIYHCYFDCIRHAVVFQGGCNAMQVRNNTIGETCGDAATGMTLQFGAPFLFSANVTHNTTGNQIHDNLVECVHYAAIARANPGGYAIANTIGPNTQWDAPTMSVPLAVLDSTSIQNYVNDEVYRGGKVWNMYDANLGVSSFASGMGSTSTGTSQRMGPEMFYNSTVSRSATGFATEGQWGARSFLSNTGPSVLGRPPVTSVQHLVPASFTDAATISGTPYVTSATAAFTYLDIGAYAITLTAAVTAGSRILWTFHAADQGIISWQPSAAYTLGQFAVPTVTNAHLYQCTTAGTTGSSQPTWPTGGGTVTDGSAVWTDMGSATGCQVSANATATTAGNTLYFGRPAGSAVTQVSFNNGHIIGSTASPAYAAGATAQVGTGATVTVQSVNSDLGHQVVLTTGTGTLAAGLLCTGTPGNTFYGSATVCAITPVNAAAAGLGLYGDLRATATWKISCVNAPAASTAYIFNVLTLG